MAEAERHEPDERRRRVGLQLLWLWILIVVLYFSWEVATYRGLFAMIAEWQFERLGQDLPTLNFSLLAVLFAWPALLLVRLRFRRREREEDGNAERRFASRQRALAISITEAAQEYMHVLFGFASALGIAAVISLAWILILPTYDRPARPLTPYASTTQPQDLSEGPVTFDGHLTYGRIASFGRGILFVRHTVLYAPIKPPPGADPRIRYFVEFLPAERADIASGGTISHRSGILVRGDMPGALIRLYRYLGYQIAPHYYVLYASRTTLRWPYYMLAAQFAVAAIAFLLAALWQRLHVRRLIEDVVEHGRRAVTVRERHRREKLGLISR